MKAKKLLSILAIAIIALISGCEKDDFQEVIGVCPVVLSTIPVDGASGVPLDQVISATFNEAMDPATITPTSFIITVAGVPVAGTITYAGNTATFTPAARLAVTTLYTGKITTAVKDATGNAMQADYVWTFTTDVNPLVASTDPANLAVNVSPNKIITATFNMSMNPLTINATTFTVKQGANAVAGTVTYAGTMATFTPSVPLAENTAYTATITKGATNLAGTELAADYVWTFTTGLKPTVILTDPLPNAIGVALNKVISATFSVPMDPVTISATTFTVKQGNTPVLGTITYTGTKASFTPTAPLAPNKVYTVTITNGVKNLAGTNMASDYVWSFTTDISPIVTDRDPLPNATGVALNKVISVTFNMPMNLLTLNAATFTVKRGAITLLGTITPNASATTFTFTPAVPLIGNTLYTVTITTGAQNTTGTGLASDDVWNFTTLAPVIPPVNTGNGLGFGVFGGNAGITNQGLFTVVNGSIGTTAASSLVTGFTDGTNGDTYTVTPLNDGVVRDGIFTDAPAPGDANKAATALAGLNAARVLYNSISPASRPLGTVISGGAGELGGLTLAPGTYIASASTLAITNGNLTLDAQGDANAKWYFQAPSSLTVGDSAPSSVVFKDGIGDPNNVYWYVGSTAVINYAGGGVMVGNILADSGVTLSSPANSTNPTLTVLNGRAISLVASVTMVNTVINVPN